MDSVGFIVVGVNCGYSDALTGSVFTKLCSIWCLLISEEFVSNDELGMVKGAV